MKMALSSYVCIVFVILMSVLIAGSYLSVGNNGEEFLQR